MKSEIRLAHFQGLLQGRHLSPIQHHAGFIWIFMENADRGEAELNQIKLALISTGSEGWKPEELFPNRFSKPKERQEEQRPEDLDPNAAFDYSEVTWRSPSSLKVDELSDLMRQIETINKGTITGEQLGADQGWM